MVNAITSGDILSAEQLKKHSKVYAGPGAGKTYFLVYLIFFQKRLAKLFFCGIMVSESKKQKNF